MLYCVGAVLVDETAKLRQALNPGASNPAHWKRSVGGVAANVFTTASKHVPATLIAAVGDDDYGHRLQTHFGAQSDSCCVLPGFATGRYCAVLDPQGELVIGLADSDIVEQLTWDMIKSKLAGIIPSSSDTHLVFDANLSVNCIRDICEKTDSLTLTALTVSPIKAMRLLDRAHAIDLLLTNRAEAAALTGLPVSSDMQRLSEVLLQSGFRRHVITDRAGDILIYDTEQLHRIPVKAIVSTPSVNGAGDALAGATVANWSTGMTLRDAVAGPGLHAARAFLSGQYPAASLF